MKTALFLATLILPVSFVVAEPEIEVTPLAIDFGEVEIGVSHSATVTIKNVGDSAITISSIELLQAGNDFSITATPYLPTFFGAGGYVEVEITFTPSAGNTISALLQIGSSDPDTPVTEVTLTGTGLGGETTPQEQVEAVIDFLEASVEEGTITGNGPGKSAKNRLKAFGNMLKTAESLIQAGNYDEASAQLKSVRKHSDGKDKPKDFVDGSALPQLAELLQELLDLLDSET